MKTVLTIAGSDPSGGAGIQADIKTITVHGMYAMSAVTALTAQNTAGVSGIWETPAVFLAAQLDSAFADIFPDAVKIGMLGSAAAVSVTAEKLEQYRPVNIVIDPVMISTSGNRLLSDEALSEAISRLFHLADLLTPNIPETESLCGFPISGEDDMAAAAACLCKRFGCAVLVKGGHLSGDAADLLMDRGRITWYRSARIANPNTHGTGCTLSSAIACGLAAGLGREESVKRAKSYLSGAIADGLDLGKGAGPLNHMYALQPFLSRLTI